MVPDLKTGFSVHGEERVSCIAHMITTWKTVQDLFVVVTEPLAVTKQSVWTFG